MPQRDGLKIPRHIFAAIGARGKVDLRIVWIGVQFRVIALHARVGRGKGDSTANELPGLFRCFQKNGQRQPGRRARRNFQLQLFWSQFDKPILAKPVFCAVEQPRGGEIGDRLGQEELSIRRPGTDFDRDQPGAAGLRDDLAPGRLGCLVGGFCGGKSRGEKAKADQRKDQKTNARMKWHNDGMTLADGSFISRGLLLTGEARASRVIHSARWDAGGGALQRGVPYLSEGRAGALRRPRALSAQSGGVIHASGIIYFLRWSIFRHEPSNGGENENEYECAENPGRALVCHQLQCAR